LRKNNMQAHDDIYTKRAVNLIIEKRKELGISQIELANRSGLPQSTIARIETHKLHIRLDTLMKILAVLNCDLLLADNNVLETDRLILRKLKEEDAQAMFDGWCSDPDVTKYMTWNPHKNIEETRNILDEWIEDYNSPDTIRYGICLKDTMELIGAIDVVDYVEGNPEIGYVLSKKYWNNGYMSEALSALVKYLFSIGSNEIVIEAKEDNIASNRVIEKCGFIFTKKEHKEKWSMFKPIPVTVNWYKISKY